MMLQSNTLLFSLSLILAWLFDFLFWDKPAGVSFPVFVALALAAGFYLARRNKIRIAGRSLWLLAPIAFFSLLSLLRLEPFTLLLSRAFALLGMALLATSFIGGRWPEYSFGDYIAKLIGFVPAGLLKQRQTNMEGNGEPKRIGWGQAASILRGLLLALPVLGVLGVLLATADPVFGEGLDKALSFLNLENLIEYLWRGTYIVLLAFLLVGVYTYALLASQDEQLIGEDKPMVQPFLGFVEAITVLISVDLLFAAFVAVQFRYFFGGSANISFAGYTYAEYARRGFLELVAVAVLSLLLFMALSAVSHRPSGGQQKTFSGLGVALMALVSIILVSAYQRLLLYESAYGFTRIRTYSHAFMIWLGLLLALVVVLELSRRQRAFSLAILSAAAGFALSLGLLNVDGFIANANLDRARLGYSLDVAHLGQLSEDATPALVRQFEQARSEGDDDLAAQIAAALACQAAQTEEYTALPDWQSWHWSRSRAQQAWQVLNQNNAYRGLDVSVEGSMRDGFIVSIGSETFDCWQASLVD